MNNIKNQETIKPSSPTPLHLNRYNLSYMDYKSPNIHYSSVFLYKNYKKDDINRLKKSLSKCLTQYYPFAGRLPSASASQYIKCNDEGVVFLEACVDFPLQDLVLNRDPDETKIKKLVPNVGNESNRVLEVQVNHFSCGGVAVAVSLSHKVADGLTMAYFVNHWATVTRGGSPINPTFVSAPVRDDTTTTTTNVHQDDQPVMKKVPSKFKCTAKRFVISNSKLANLKNKINSMAAGMSPTPMNPSRVESLISLLFKSAVNAAATTKKAGSFQPSNLSLTLNMREKVGVSTVPLRYAVGNILNLAVARMDDSSEIELDKVINRLRKDRMEIDGAAVSRDVEELGEMFFKKRTGLRQDQSRRTYSCTSLCNLPIYKVDFGWGKPVRVILPTDNWNDSSYFIMMDAASGDGIEATVILKEEEMTLFQNDKEFLAFVQD
uniref:tabersonine-19-hydroxy-O-acetyltransferase-like n=1 Tax=Erigeron canadensis TaxID=72917 RepID=UPI001CB924B8|nr:tabersonine-19-hydroxy-O-acetyltransferase-like [Erigeron canadensis]